MDWAVIGTARASPIVASPRRFQFAAEVLETNQRMSSPNIRDVFERSNCSGA
jgi:hypothetical protein